MLAPRDFVVQRRAAGLAVDLAGKAAGVVAKAVVDGVIDVRPAFVTLLMAFGFCTCGTLAEIKAPNGQAKHLRSPPESGDDRLRQAVCEVQPEDRLVPLLRAAEGHPLKA